MDNINNKKKYWFCVDTYVHISVQDNSALFYNSLTGKIVEYSNEPVIQKLAKKFHNIKNLRMVQLNERDLENPVIKKFVFTLRKKFMGDLLETSFSEGKPIQFPPVVKIQNEIHTFIKGQEVSVGENMMFYVTEVSFFINNECSQSCAVCSGASKQFQFCTARRNGNKELEISKINKMLEELMGGQVAKFNILGGDIFRYSKLPELIDALKSYNAQKIFYSHYLNVVPAHHKLELLDTQNSLLNILVTSPIDKSKLKTAIEMVKQADLKSQYTFLIRDEAEFNEAEAVVSELDIEEYECRPYYNGENFSFFRENIFMDKDEILGVKPSMKGIYQNMKVNNLDFGRIVILSNGNIHANVNTTRLGILGRDSIYDVVYKEMYHGKSWRRLRRNVSPCRQCNFQAICPPLSNYSYAIGKNDLCHIHDGVSGE